MIGSPEDVVHKEAWEKFLKKGLPTRRDEAFRYVRLSPIYKAELPHAQGDFDWEGEGAIALPLAEAKKAYGAILQKRIKNWIQKEEEPFALLNGAFERAAFFVYIPPKISGEFRLTHKGPLGFHHPRIYLHIGKGAEVTLTLDERADGCVNRMVDLSIEEGARLKLKMIHTGDRQLDTFRGELKRDAYFESVLTRCSGTLLRQDYHFALQGEGARADLYGLSDLNQSEQAHYYVTMEHVAAHTHSMQKFKGVLRGESRTSFEGKIYVHPQAQKTEAYQLSNYLLLSEGASANCKPNLEIFADDVKASHGATVGQLDQEALFYLQSRGISLENARTLLIQSFLEEIYAKL